MSATAEISIFGKLTRVPCLNVTGRNVVIRGKWIKIASVHDEYFFPGETVPEPESYLTAIRSWDAKPDLFAFCQKITDPTPKFKYFHDWDNFAVIPITTYEEWLKSAKKDVKENLRRATREGVVVKVCEYNDEFVRGIKALYDETTVRQGMRFWHHGKPFERVKAENGTYLERSEYIGAFLGDELIGFLKMVYVGEIAKTMQVFSSDKYFHKRPANAMIAKAVEVCAAKGIRFFNYGHYQYPGKQQSSLTDFKARQGFRRFDFPRYYIPLTLKGKLYVALRLHRGFKRFIPSQVLTGLLKMRAAIYGYLAPRPDTSRASLGTSGNSQINRAEA
jgi:hypothetical protein